MSRAAKITRWAMGAGAVACALVLALPLWFPWVLRPVARHFGLRYSHYERAGMLRFHLVAVEFQTIKAARVDALLPTAWLWSLTRPSAAEDFLVVHGWSVTSDTPPPPGPAVNPKPKKIGPRAGFHPLVEELRPELALLRQWVPKAALYQGNLRIAGQAITLPSVVWSDGTLTAAVEVPARANGITAQAHLPSSGPWSLTARSAPWDVNLSATLSESANATALEGALTWRTNTLKWAAAFPATGWLPHTASAAAPALKLPLEPFGIREYSDLTGSVAFRWMDGQVAAQVSGKAAPASSRPALPAVDLAFDVTGTTNALRIAEAQIRAPGLTVDVSPGAIVDWQGHLRSESAQVDLALDLSQQDFFPVSGSLRARVFLEKGAAAWPDATGSITATHLQYQQFRLSTLSAKAELNWPVLTVDSLTAAMGGGLEASLDAAANLATETIQRGRISAAGPLTNSWLAETLQADEVHLEAHIAGPWRAPAHSGELRAQSLVLFGQPPSSARMLWKGQGANLEIDSALSRGESQWLAELRTALEGKALATTLNELRFETNGQPVYHLDAPARILVAPAAQPHTPASEPMWQVQVEPIRWIGPERSVQFEGNVAWPKRGVVHAEIQNFDPKLLDPFLPPLPVPAVLNRLSASAQWSNSPVRFELDLDGGLPAQAGLPLNVRARVRGDATGVALDELLVSTTSGAVLSGQGSAPLIIDPGHTNGILVLNRSGPVALQAWAGAAVELWDRVEALTRVRLVRPEVEVRVTGSLAAPEGEVKAQAAGVQIPQLTSTNRPAPRLEQVRLDLGLTRASLQIKRLSANIEEQPVRATAEIPLGDDPTKGWRHFFQWNKSTGRVEIAKAEVAPLARFLPETIAPQGNLTLDLEVRPGLQLSGDAALQGMATRPLPSIGPVGDLEAKVKFSGRRMELARLSGEVGGQPFSVDGRIDFAELDSRTGLPQMQLNLRGDGIPLARQPDLIVRADLDLAVRLETNRNEVSGSVRLRDSIFLSDLRTLIPGKVSQPRQRPPYFSVDLEPLADWRLALEVKGDRFMKVRTPFFRGEVSTDLKVEGTLKEPLALGEVTVPAGVVQFPFANLELNQAIVSLTSADPYHPTLFVTGGSRLFGYDVRMEVSGKADSPVIQFSSTPPLSSEQVLLMLTTGEIPNRAGTFSNQQRIERLALFLGRNLLSEFGNGAAGADRLTLRTGEYISDEGKQTYSLEYRLTDNWSIVGEYDRFGAFNADLKWRIYSR